MLNAFLEKRSCISVLMSLKLAPSHATPYMQMKSFTMKWGAVGMH